MEKQRKIRRSRAQWESLLQAFQQSNLSVQQFCQANHLAESSFYKWQHQLGTASGSDGAKLTALNENNLLTLIAPDSLHSPSANDWLIELTLGPGCTLRIRQPL